METHGFTVVESAVLSGKFWARCAEDSARYNRGRQAAASPINH